MCIICFASASYSVYEQKSSDVGVIWNATAIFPTPSVDIKLLWKSSSSIEVLKNYIYLSIQIAFASDDKFDEKRWYNFSVFCIMMEMLCFGPLANFTHPC